MNYRHMRNDRGVLCGEIEGRLMHSTRNPEKEARALVSRNLDSSPSHVLVLGLGLGYHLHAIQSIHPQCRMLCIEPDADWPQEFNSLGLRLPKNCTLVAGEQLAPWMQRELPGSYAFFALEGYRLAYPELYQRIRQKIEGEAGRSRINHNTLRRFGQRWVENIFMNFLGISQEGRLEGFEKLFTGKPALLLAGGPSLEQLLPHLPALREKFVIAAVDTAYLSCRRQGYEPDILVAVDPQYWNTKHLEDYAPRDEQPAAGRRQPILVSESSAHPRIFRLIDSVPHFTASFFPLGRYFEEALPPRPVIASGGSVATTAFDLLCYAGCSDIICAGLDLGFPDNQTHFRGSYFEERMASSAQRFAPLEQQSLLYLHSGSPVPREDNSGGRLLSDARMDLFSSWFTRQIEANPGIGCYSLSSKGRKIPGMKLISMDELYSYPDVRRDISATLDRLGENGQPALRTGTSGPESRPELRTLFFSLKDELELLNQHCSEGLALLKDYASRGSGIPADQRGPLRDSLISDLDEIDSRILASGRSAIGSFLIQDVIQRLEQRQNPEDFDQSLEYSGELYRELRQATATHLHIMERVASRLDAKALLKIYSGQADNQTYGYKIP